MRRNVAVINLLYGSVLAGAFTTILSAWLVSYESTHSSSQTDAWTWVYLAAIFLLVVLSSVFTWKFAHKSFPSWPIAPLVLLVVFALYVVGVLPREIWYLQIFPEAVLVFAVINAVVLFFHSKKKQQEYTKEDSSGKSLFIPITTVLVITFVVPALLAAYMRFLLPPKVVFFDNGPTEIEYDQPPDNGPWGMKDLGPGLYLEYGTGLRGDYDMRYELHTTAYLLSSDNGDFGDSKSFVRRARFGYSTGDGRQIFDGPDGWNHLFLPYEIVVNGTVQGGFDNYRPEALSDILAKNENTEFAVELIARVKQKSSYPGQQIETLSQLRKIVPMSYEQTRSENREKYLKSQWVALLKGTEWQQQGQQMDRPAAALQTAKPAVVPQVKEPVNESPGRDKPEQADPIVTPETGNTEERDEWEDI